LAGYYAHISALDALLGDLDRTLHDCGLADDTLLVFTSDHGDMVGSHPGRTNKQCPYDESVLVPFLLRWPRRFGAGRREIRTPLDAPDILPTLLDLCGIDIPASVEGRSIQAALQSDDNPADEDGVLIASYTPIADWNKVSAGGREYRGLRTPRYTYVRDHQGPWLLFDNTRDPWQLDNRVADLQLQALRQRLDAVLETKLAQRGDDFPVNTVLLERWRYPYDATGTVPFAW
jgi:arylsulfatase A-like enzyme